jgi:putative membrane protein
MALAITLLPHILPGVAVSSFYSAVIVAVIFGLLNLIVKPIISLVTLPINMLTLGLFGLVVNGALLYFTASFVDGFTIVSFMIAFMAAVYLAIVNWLAHLI